MKIRSIPQCRTCRYFPGQTNVSNVSSYLTCAVHPYGPDGDECGDWKKITEQDAENDDRPIFSVFTQSRPTHYILNGHTPVPVEDLLQWARSLDGIRDVAKTQVNNILVSTVFLGIDHRFFGEGLPILFETMCFPDAGCSDFQVRYCTWEEAEAGHWNIVEQLRSGVSVDD